MSDADSGSIIEGLSSEEYEYLTIDKLKEHPKNEEIYGKTDPDESFVEDIRNNGIETPVVVNEHEDCPDTVIGGHQRVEAAKRSGYNRVPIRWVSYPEPMATIRVIKNNKQREKTAGQKANEAIELDKQYRNAGKENQGERTDLSPTLGKSNHDTEEQVAADVGVSKGTIRKGIEVKRMAYPEEYVHDDLRNPEKYDVSEEVREIAREQVEKMDEGEQSFHGAISEVEDKQEEVQSEEVVESVDETLNADAEASYDIEEGGVWQLGDHRLYCGDTSSEEFQEFTPQSSAAFADPPYNADNAEWDRGFEWSHDWLMDKADVVAVTPGIVSIPDFHTTTEMPYRWAVSCWIDNGMARGELGFGNWVYVSLFSELDSLHQNSQDIVRVTIQTSETEDTDHKGRKPSELMEWYVATFSDKGDTVVDPFAGSGSTLLTCEKMNRRCVTGEIKPEFCGRIIGRWEEMTDSEASVVESI